MTTITETRRGWNWVVIIRRDGEMVGAGVDKNKAKARETAFFTATRNIRDLKYAV